RLRFEREPTAYDAAASAVSVLALRVDETAPATARGARGVASESKSLPASVADRRGPGGVPVRAASAEPRAASTTRFLAAPADDAPPSDGATVPAREIGLPATAKDATERVQNVVPRAPASPAADPAPRRDGRQAVLSPKTLLAYTTALDAATVRVLL